MNISNIASKLSHVLLIATIILVTIPFVISAMECPREDPGTPDKLLGFVSQDYGAERSISIHHQLVAWIRKFKAVEIKELFEQAQDETYKMALRLIYAEKERENLDFLDCGHFIENIKNWVNHKADIYNSSKTKLFSQEYLPFVLPLLEPFIKAKVTTLYLAGNKLTSMPDSICSLVNLKSLGVSWNELNCLPDGLVKLYNLEKLALTYNKLGESSRAVTLPKSLQSLDLGCNEIMNVSNVISNISELKNLQYFSLAHNKLIEIPDEFGELCSLTQLYLNLNQLTGLPGTMNKLADTLTRLDFSRNLTTEGIRDALAKRFPEISF